MYRLAQFALSCLCTSVICLAFNTAHAQQLDPNLLRQLQERSGQAMQSTQSPVDTARARTQESGVPGLQERSAAERERDALRARQEIDAAYKPSRIEVEFRNRANDQTLRQFGYDLFRTIQAERTPLSGRVSDDYVLGIGDEVVVILQGATARNITTRVDREGRLIIDQLRPLPAAGRTLGSVRRDIELATKSALLGTEAFVSVGDIRAASVIVAGEVERPGQFSVNSMTDVLAALAQAGGIRTTGSLRRVRLERAGQTIMIDLYGLLGLGRTNSVRLQDGDRIIVPAIGPVIAVTGGVARPGIYELASPSRTSAVSLEQALDFAGNVIRPQGNDFVVQRFSQEGTEQVIALQGLTTRLQAGDLLRVSPREGGGAGRFTLSGFFDAPGVRPLERGATIRSVLGRRENLKLNSYLPFAVLIRPDSITRSPTYSGVDLVRIFQGDFDIPLQNDDELVVLPRTAINIARSLDVRRILLGDDADLQICEAYRFLAANVRDTQGGQFATALRGNFIVARQGQVTVANRQATQANLDTASAALEGQARSSRDAQAASETQARAQEVRPQERSPEEAKLFTQQGCLRIFEQHPQILPLLLENLAIVSGAVREPGGYPIVEGASLATLLSAAGGTLNSANLQDVEISQPSDNSAQRQRFDLTSAQPATLLLKPGDEARVPQKEQIFEAGAVLLSGEVARPGLYPIRKGEKLSELIKRAGGYLPDAYPYGAVFSRRSVQAAQQDGFRRTARELTQSILTLSTRREGNSDAILAATNFARQLENTQASGRLVVEADINVLERRPDLDTILEAGDTLLIPKKPNFVLSVGDLLNPGALQFIPGKRVDAYLAESGGLQSSADDDRIFVVYPNGIAQPMRRSFWRRGDIAIPPGTAIVVPKDLNPLGSIDLIRDISSIVSQFAVSIASVAVISQN